MGIKSLILPSQKGSLDESYINDVDYVVWNTELFYSFEGPNKVYDALHHKAKMLFCMDKKDAAGIFGESYELRKALVKDRTIKSIFSYEKPVFEDFTSKMIFVLVNNESNSIVHIGDFLKGDSIDISSETIDSDCLWPSYYMTHRPTYGIPLSELVSFKKLSEPKQYGISINSDQLESIPLFVPSRMAEEYKDANLASSISYLGDKSVPNKWRVGLGMVKEPCVLIYGNENKYVAGYIQELPENGGGTLRIVVCLVPKHGIDIRYITALLFTPEVKNQIQSICSDDISTSTLPLVLNEIIVPNHTDKERLAFLSEANYEAMLSSQKELKQKHDNYRKAVRLRKHALTQKLLSMDSTFDALNYYRVQHGGKLLDTDIISRVTGLSALNAFESLAVDFKNMMSALEHIADVEYSFSDPEWINPEAFIEDYISKNAKRWTNFTPVTKWKKGQNIISIDLKDFKKGEPFRKLFFPKEALERVLDNIVANAVSHGFTDKRRQDYQLRFSWHSDGLSIFIEIENNGTPIPADRDADSLLEYGVSSALHQDGHNGIGCNEINEIMLRYDGSVEIISLPDKDFPVKYILTFNLTNLVQPK